MAATSLRLTARLFQPRSYQSVVLRRKWTPSMSASAVITLQVVGGGAQTAASSPMPILRPGAKPGLSGAGKTRGAEAGQGAGARPPRRCAARPVRPRGPPAPRDGPLGPCPPWAPAAAGSHRAAAAAAVAATG